VDEFKRGWVGVSYQSVTDDIADSFGLDRAPNFEAHAWPLERVIPEAEAAQKLARFEHQHFRSIGERSLQR